jgi:hypothetical protein
MADHVKIVGAMTYEAITQKAASAEGVAVAAELPENFARVRRAGANGGGIPRGTAAP